MQIFSKTDIGKVRATNQDAFAFEELPDGKLLIIVCDGMGGANAGNIASENAVRIIKDYFLRSYRKGSDSTADANLLKNAVASANLEIYDMSVKNPEYTGMGTTVVAGVVSESKAVICHAGDSRVYLVNDDVVQLTRDHSVVQSLIESGKLSASEAKFHPKKNVITRALGAESNIISDICETPLKKDDFLIFCTDGLTNFTENEDIKKILDSSEEKDVAKALVDKANSNGGGDNITVVAVRLTRAETGFDKV